jgi:hypothetical protein
VATNVGMKDVTAPAVVLVRMIRLWTVNQRYIAMCIRTLVAKLCSRKEPF